MKLRTLREKRLRVAYRCARACTISARLTIDAATARRLGLAQGAGAVTIGRASGSRATAGSATLGVRLTARARRALRGARRFTLRVATELRGDDSAGAVSATRRVAVSR
jgi:hypothetical protein